MRPGLLNFQHRGPQLIRTVLVLLKRLEQTPKLIDRKIIAADIRSEVLGLLELCFKPVQQHDAWIIPRNRCEEAVDIALSKVWRSQGRTNAWEMADLAGVSQRTLEIAFASVVGMTPGKYLKLHRLNQSYQVLAQGDGQATNITELALSLGFSHPGRFSASYRQLFGETPSETLSS